LADLRTLVTFRAAGFNTTESRPEYINPGNYGDDLGRWLIGELKRHGVSVADYLGQEDHGWYVTYTVEDTEYTFILGYREDGRDSDWVGWVERSVGFVASILGARKKGIKPDGVAAIHKVLTGSDRVREVKWHYPRDFESGREDRGIAKPE
jgi:hypothetical protein